MTLRVLNKIGFTLQEPTAIREVVEFPESVDWDEVQIDWVAEVIELASKLNGDAIQN